MIWILLTSCRHLYRYSDAFFVYSGQLLASRKALTVAKTLWVWMGSVEADTGLGDAILGPVISFYRRYQWG